MNKIIKLIMCFGLCLLAIPSNSTYAKENVTENTDMSYKQECNIETTSDLEFLESKLKEFEKSHPSASENRKNDYLYTVC